jgi:hypothetical protein
MTNETARTIKVGKKNIENGNSGIDTYSWDSADIS